MKLVVFDCDGTLVDSQHMIAAAMEAAFAGHGLPAPGRRDILSVVGLSLAEAVQRLVPDAAPGDVEALAESYKSAFGVLRRQEAHKEPLYPGVREALAHLNARHDVVLGVATGKSRRGLAAVLEREGLDGHFVTLQTADTHPSKPHPAMLRAAMAEAGADAHRTVMIGDTTYDIDMARNAGAHAIGVAWGYHAPDELRLAGAQWVFDDSRQLATAIDGVLHRMDAP